MNQVNFTQQNLVRFKSAQNLQEQQIPQMQYEHMVPDVQIPDIYNIPNERRSKEDIVESIKKYDMLGMIHPWITHPFMMLGSFAGLCWGVDKFAKSCGGEYEKSLVGKAARFGDNLQESSFIKSKPMQSIINLGKSAKNKINHIFRNSDVVNAIKTTPSRPEWNFVQGELHTMNQRVVEDFSKVMSTHKLTSEGFPALTELGLDKGEKEFLKKLFKGADALEAHKSGAIQLKRIGKTDTEILEILSKPDAINIVKAEQLNKLGLDAEFLRKIETNPATLKDIVKVNEACKNAKGMRIGAGHQKCLGPFQIFERKIGIEEIGNRLHSTLRGAKTKTGRALATFIQKCHRGFTFGGGKIGVLLFISPMLVETMLDVKKAEPKQKIGTAVHGLVESCSWVFTFPLALSIMHSFGGAQYAGMGPEKVKQYRKLISEFNEKVENGFFKSYEKYSKALKELKFGADGKGGLNALKKVEGQTLFTKISRKLGQFLTMDLETIKAYKGSGSFNVKNVGRKVSNVCRNIGGVPMRVGIWAGISMGILGAGITKGINMIFGKHYDRFKEEEFTNAKKEQKKFLKEDLQSRLFEAQRRKVMGEISPETESLLNNSQNQEHKQIIPESIKDFANKNNNNTLEHSEKEVPVPNFVETKTSSTVNDKKITQDSISKKEEKQTLENNTTESKNIKKQQIQDIKESQEVQTNNEISNNVEPQDSKIIELVKETEIKPVTTTIETKPNQEVLTSKNNTSAKLVQDNYDYIPNPKAIKTQTIQNRKRDNYTYIPSSENIIKNDKNNEETNKYIPSQEGAKFTKTFDNSGLEDALKRADRAEQKALQVLAGNFKSYY